MCTLVVYMKNYASGLVDQLKREPACRSYTIVSLRNLYKECRFVHLKDCSSFDGQDRSLFGRKVQYNIFT